MGKSNKFDYTNRSNSGPKLGQIIGSALQKEAEKVQKDAERHLQKARKQSVDSTSASSDSPTTTHVIDLKAPGKDLGDDGVCALLDGLEIALKSSTRQVSLVLVELDLSGNCITTVSLARLAPVVELAWHDMKSLNLASNNIKVETAREAAQWDIFLQSFRGCSKLQTLTFKDNSALGHRAMEIMARVHTAQQRTSISFSPRRFSTSSATSDSNESGDDNVDIRTEDTDGADTERDPSVNGESSKHHAHGLRSIPYINLQSVGLDDAGAMWLSYVLQDHLYPSQLNQELRTVQSEATTKIFHPESKGQGLEWAENKTLGKEGIHLLEKSELLRRQFLLEEEVTSTKLESGDVDSVAGNHKDKRKSMDDRMLKLPQDQRRASIKSVRTSDSGEHEVNELESARKKVKRAIIAHDGASSVELWHSALNLVRTSRLLLFVAPTIREIYIGPPLFKRADALVSPRPPSQSSDDSDIRHRFKGLSIDASQTHGTIHDVHAPVVSNHSRSGILDKVGQPNEILEDMTNGSGKAMTLHKMHQRKGAFGEGNGLQTVNRKLSRLSVRNEDPLRFVRYQEQRIAAAARERRHFRDTDMPCHLPCGVVEQITRYLTTGYLTRVLNEKQKGAAVEWGQRRETLSTEREWLRKDESAQVLMLLDSIDCLAYGQ